MIKDVQLTFASDGTMKKIRGTSPDVIGSASHSLNFDQIDNKVTFSCENNIQVQIMVVE